MAFKIIVALALATAPSVDAVSWIVESNYKAAGCPNAQLMSSSPQTPMDQCLKAWASQVSDCSSGNCTQTTVQYYEKYLCNSTHAYRTIYNDSSCANEQSASTVGPQEARALACSGHDGGWSSVSCGVVHNNYVVKNEYNGASCTGTSTQTSWDAVGFCNTYNTAVANDSSQSYTPEVMSYQHVCVGGTNLSTYIYSDAACNTPIPVSGRTSNGVAQPLAMAGLLSFELVSCQTKTNSGSTRSESIAGCETGGSGAGASAGAGVNADGTVRKATGSTSGAVHAAQLGVALVLVFGL